MTQFQSLLEPLGWAVLHSIWQGALVLGLVLALRRLAGPSRPHLAYLAGTVGLVVTFAAFLVTLVIAMGTTGSPPPLIPGGSGVTAAAVPTLTSPGGAVLPAIVDGGSIAWDAALPWLGALWAVGFFVLSLQCMYAWAKTRCYATLGLSAPEGDWAARFASLVERAGVRSDIRLQVSALVESPVTLGTLKPLVLVPAGFLTGFPPAQVEAILLHEIAHIRRHDFIVGLIQTAIRTTLYFNPAVRLMSRLVDEDREQACDDFAVAKSGRPLDLAKGLAALRLSLAPSPVMAANDGRSGPLMARLERIVGQGSDVRGLDRLTAAGLGVALVGAALFAPDSWAHPHRWESDGDMDEEIVMPPAPPALPALPNMADILSAPPTPPAPPATEAPVPPSLDSSKYKGMSYGDRMEAWGRDMEVWGEQMDAWGEQYGEAMEKTWAPKMEAWGEQMESEWAPKMEAWGEKMESEWAPKVEAQAEAWAEAFGDSFEDRMEHWAEEMEEWGESFERDAEHIEYFDDMSDAELKKLGLTRSDVELAAEDYGLTVAEGVVASMLAGGLEDEARAEIAAERAELDQKRLAIVKKKMEAELDRTRTLDRSYKERDKARAERDKMRAKRDAARAKRDAERAVRDAERAKRYAERDAARAAKSAKTAIQLDELTETLSAHLRDDGLIARNDKNYRFKICEGEMLVDGQMKTTDTHKRYLKLLNKAGLEDFDEFEMKVRGNQTYIELAKDDDVTRVTMVD